MSDGKSEKKALRNGKKEKSNRKRRGKIFSHIFFIIMAMRPPSTRNAPRTVHPLNHVGE